jgi:hypothetical protein
MDGLKQWKCEKGHVLGVVQRVKVESGYVSRLMLFRHAIDLENGKVEDVDVIANIEGTTLDVACDVEKCGRKRTWFMSAEGVKIYAAE